MNPYIVEKIYGPPGTGKTTKLLSIAESMIENCYQPRDICVVTFTRKGAHEAKSRAIDKFHLNPEDLPWWRTLHSMAFTCLGMNRSQIMAFGDYIALCGQLGLSITNKGMSEDGTISGQSKGDRLFFMENMARATMMDLKEYWENNYMEDIAWYELERVSNTIKEYKRANNKKDFTDIIYDFLSSPICPPIKALIVDEAQDLTPLQWKMVDKLADGVDSIWIAGDDDQAIFKWAGADVNAFTSLPGRCSVLPQSYRVPTAIQCVAEKIISRVSNRFPKKWKPTKDEGMVNHATELHHIDMSEGTWLLLGRNLFVLEWYNEHCLHEGYVYESHIGSPATGNTLKAIIAWENLRKGEKVAAEQVKYVYDLMKIKEKVRYGFKSKLDKLQDNMLLTLDVLRKDFGLLTDIIWHKALDRIPEQEREYLISALRRGEKLLKEPRIKINTIHGVKGGEADNVVVFPDMAARTWQEFQDNPDDEHRVWYVAATRAKKALWLMTPRTDKAYDLPT